VAVAAADEDDVFVDGGGVHGLIITHAYRSM
jgi:hypothetical protein